MSTGFRHLSLRHLRLIAAIADLGQLGLAADRLAVSQPAASRMLAEAERQIGLPIFQRLARGMVPTQAGRVVTAHALAVVHRLDQAEEEIAAHLSGRAGRLDIGTVTGPAVAHVVPALRRLKAEAPGARIGIDVAPSLELVEGLIRGDYDLVLGRVPDSMDPRQFEILSGRVEEVELLLRADHPLARHPGPAPLAELRRFPWVLQRTGMPIRVAIEQAFAHRGLPPPDDTIDTASLLLTMAILADSDAIAPVTREVAALLSHLATQGLTTLRLDPQIVLTPYHILRLKDRDPSPLCARAVAILSDRLAPPRRGGSP